MKYEIEVYDKEYKVIKNDNLSLMGLRVFCEQEMYTKLNSGEISSIIIAKEDEEDGNKNG